MKARANTKTYTLLWAMAWLLCLTASGARAENAALVTDEAFVEPFQPDYLQPSLYHLPLGVVMGQDNRNHFNAYGMDNAALDRAASHLSDNRMLSSHRIMNHHWLYIESNNLKWRRGSKIVSDYLKSKARVYWDNLQTERRAKRARERGYTNGPSHHHFNYDMDLSTDSVEFNVSYEFY